MKTSQEIITVTENIYHPNTVIEYETITNSNSKTKPPN